MIELRILGTLELRDAAGQEIRRVLAQPKRLALLVYLVLGRTSRRDTLLALFWPDHTEARARLALRQAVHFLREALGADVIVNRTGEEIALGEGVCCDAVALERALGEGRLLDAVELYRGDLLPGFHAGDVSQELEEWLEHERQAVRTRVARASWSLAESAEREGNGVEAAHRARQAMRFAPDDEAGFRRFASLLHRLGDRSGALRAYDDFARRLRAGFDVEPAAETRVLIDAIRSDERVASMVDPSLAAVVDARAHRERAAANGHASATSTSAEIASDVTTSRRDWWTRRPARAAILVAAMAVATLGAATLSARWVIRPAPPTIAVGLIRNAGGDSAAASARILTGLLATDLARVRGLPVVSDTRLYEILGQLGVAELTEQSFADAARRAGAAELIEGVLYRQPGGLLRLDVRRVRAGDGVVRAVYTAEGADAFDVADRVSASIARAFNLSAPTRPLAASASGSAGAREVFDEGLRAFHRGNTRGSFDLFATALRVDTTFAMAAFYASLTESTSRDSARALLDRAVRLAEFAPERERLIIRLTWLWNEPARARPVADSLVTRYPNEPHGHLMTAQLHLSTGDYPSAVAALERVIAMDSLSLQGKSAQCRACDAYRSLVNTYVAADSLPAAERTAREWIDRQPRSAVPLHFLAGIASQRGDRAHAIAARQRAEALEAHSGEPFAVPRFALMDDDFVEADRLLGDRVRYEGDTEAGIDALWFQIISLRNQGRLIEARAAIDRAERLARDVSARGVFELARAQVLYESGRFRDAAVAFEARAAAAAANAAENPGVRARERTWALTHAAASWSAAGDTSRVARLAGEIDQIAPLSTFGRDWRLPHHMRGLLWQARGRHDSAVVAFRRGILSPTIGYTRANLELARSSLALGRASDAIATLQSALRGQVDASGYYLTRTEAHEVLARAFESAGERDSAVAHYQRVVGGIL